MKPTGEALVTLAPFERELYDRVQQQGAMASRAGPWVKAYLKEYGSAYVSQMHRGYSNFCQVSCFRVPTYLSFNVVIGALLKRKLIMRGREEPSSRGGYRRQYYKLDLSRVNSPAWKNPFRRSRQPTFKGEKRPLL